jgi:serine/threonine-protein kinase
MSPEQAQGNKAVDTRSDLWSLGVIVFECLTGKRPFYSDGLGDLVLQICVREIVVPSQVADVPPGFDAWFSRAVARDPDLRFQSAREMTDSLREALGVEVRDIGTPPPESVVSLGYGGLGGSQPGSGQIGASQSAGGPSHAGQPGSGSLEVAPPISSRKSGRADPSAATLAIAPAITSTLSERRRAAWAETPLPSEAPPPPSGLGSVVAVAGVALGIGLAGGFWVLRSHEPATNPEPVLPPIASAMTQDGLDPLPARSAPGASARAASAPSGSASPAPIDSAVAAAAPSASAAGAGGAATAPDASGAPPPKATGTAPKPAAERPENAAAPGEANPPTTGPNGEWVKPAWAIPDEEPTRAKPVEDEQQQP